MRITTNIIRENALATIRRTAEQMGEAQQRVSTGLRLTAASDDPTGASIAMDARSALRALDQHTRAIDSAKLRASSEESVLDQLDGILTRAKTLGITQANSSANAQTRATTRVEVDGLLRQAVALGNTELNGLRLFAGDQGTTAPFAIDATGPTLDFTTTSPTGSFELEVSAQQQVVANHNGTEIFGTATSGILASLRGLGQALKADNADAIIAAVNQVSDSLTHVQSLTAENGVRINFLESTAASLDSLKANLTVRKSAVEDVDLEQSTSELVSRQTAFQAAMLATTKVLGLTLTDYLR